MNIQNSGHFYVARRNEEIGMVCHKIFIKDSNSGSINGRFPLTSRSFNTSHFQSRVIMPQRFTCVRLPDIRLYWNFEELILIKIISYDIRQGLHSATKWITNCNRITKWGGTWFTSYYNKDLTYFDFFWTVHLKVHVINKKYGKNYF